MARVSKYQTPNTVSHSESVWNAGLYIRLSREDGDKAESESVSSQRAILNKFITDNPDITCCDCYVDDGWSGTDFDRPAFHRMIADITSGKINCVIVKDLSRFGRNYVEAGKYLETVFPLFDVRFISVNDMIDSFANPQSVNSIIVPFKNIINDEYCRDISLKVRSALDIRRKQGKFIGSFAPYGYKKSEADHNKLVIDEAAAQTVRGIFSDFLSGRSIIAITRTLNARNIPSPLSYRKGKHGEWCDTTVRRILSNEVYIGNLIQKKYEVVSHKIHVIKAVDEVKRIKTESAHESIISKSDFEKVQNLLRRDTRVSPRSQKLSIFAGFVKCADCGRAMQRRTVRQPYKTYDYYVCSTYKRTHNCTKHAIRADFLEDIVLTFLNKYISLALDFERLYDRISKERRQQINLHGVNCELARTQKELAMAKDLLTDIYPDYKSGIISKEQYFALKEKYEKAVECAQERIIAFNAKIAELNSADVGENGFIKTFKKYRGLKTLTREVVIELIDDIYIQADGSVEIHLKFKNELTAANKFAKESQELLGETDKQTC